MGIVRCRFFGAPLLRAASSWWHRPQLIWIQPCQGREEWIWPFLSKWDQKCLFEASSSGNSKTQSLPAGFTNCKRQSLKTTSSNSKTASHVEKSCPWATHLLTQMTDSITKWHFPWSFMFIMPEKSPCTGSSWCAAQRQNGSSAPLFLGDILTGEEGDNKQEISIMGRFGAEMIKECGWYR